MEHLNFQYIIAGILLLIAVIYVVRTVRRSFSEHDCTDCGVPIPKKQREHKQ